MDPQSGFERGNRQFCQIIGSAKKSKAAHFGLLTGSQFLATRKLYELNLLTILGYFLVRWTEILKSKDKQLAHLHGVDLFKARH